MSRQDRPGMATVLRHLERFEVPLSQATICYRMAQDIRAEINGLWATMNGQVSARPGKRERAHREARIDGMKQMLALALGMPRVGPSNRVDAFLEGFKVERLNAAGKH